MWRQKVPTTLLVAAPLGLTALASVFLWSKYQRQEEPLNVAEFQRLANLMVHDEKYNPASAGQTKDAALVAMEVELFKLTELLPHEEEDKIVTSALEEYEKLYREYFKTLNGTAYDKAFAELTLKNYDAVMAKYRPHLSSAEKEYLHYFHDMGKYMADAENFKNVPDTEMYGKIMKDMTKRLESSAAFNSENMPYFLDWAYAAWQEAYPDQALIMPYDRAIAINQLTNNVEGIVRGVGAEEDLPPDQDDRNAFFRAKLTAAIEKKLKNPKFKNIQPEDVQTIIETLLKSRPDD